MAQLPPQAVDGPPQVRLHGVERQKHRRGDLFERTFLLEAQRDDLPLYGAQTLYRGAQRPGLLLPLEPKAGARVRLRGDLARRLEGAFGAPLSPTPEDEVPRHAQQEGSQKPPRRVIGVPGRRSSTRNTSCVTSAAASGECVRAKAKAYTRPSWRPKMKMRPPRGTRGRPLEPGSAALPFKTRAAAPRRELSCEAFGLVSCS